MREWVRGGNLKKQLEASERGPGRKSREAGLEGRFKLLHDPTALYRGTRLLLYGLSSLALVYMLEHVLM